MKNGGYSVENNRLIDRLQLWLTIALVAFPVLPMKLTPPIIGLWALVSLIAGYPYRWAEMKKRLPMVVGFSAIFLAIVVSGLLSANAAEGGFAIEKSISLILFPVICLFHPPARSQDSMRLIARSYVLANVLLIAKIGFGVAIWGIPFNGDFSFSIRTGFEELAGMHPTYMALCILFALLIKVYFMVRRWKEISIWARIIDIAIVFLFLSFCLLISSRMPLGAFFLTVIIYLVAAIKNRKLVYAGRWGLEQF